MCFLFAVERSERPPGIGQIVSRCVMHLFLSGTVCKHRNHLAVTKLGILWRIRPIDWYRIIIGAVPLPVKGVTHGSKCISAKISHLKKSNMPTSWAKKLKAEADAST